MQNWTAGKYNLIYTFSTELSKSMSSLVYFFPLFTKELRVVYSII
jgi:hypothetical protein